MKLILRFWREYASEHQWSFALGVLFLLITNGLGVLIPKLIQWAIEAFERGDSALHLAMALLGAGVGTMFVRTLSRTFIFNPGRTIEYSLKRELFAHLLRLPRSFYEEQMTAGEIINRGTNDTASVRGLVGYGSLQLFNVAITLTLTLSQMAWLSFELSLWCIVPLFLASLVLRWAVLKMFTFHHKIMKQNGVLGDRILESYAGVGIVQMYGAQVGIKSRFDQENDELLLLSERVQAIAVWALPIVSVIGSLCVVITLYIGGSKLQAGDMTLGALTAFIVYINLLVSSLTSLGWLTGAIQRGYISLGRVYEVLDAPLGRSEESETLPSCDDLGRGLSVRNLSFSHPGSESQSLRNLSFEVSPGEVLGIFGLTGSGKSTLLDVLSRTYEPPNDTVFMDEVDITSLNINHYWREVGYVQQSPYLFSQTIRENIMLAALSDEPTEVEEARLSLAVEAACLSSEIESFPKGLETKVGERGITLSGGQKQRTSLARAFYRDDLRLLMLDDVMSAVDHNTETRLIQAIYEREPSCTTLIVSHRMSVLQEADRVIVLEDGALVDQGTPEELLSRGGSYAEAWAAQNEFAEPRSTGSKEAKVEGEVQK